VILVIHCSRPWSPSRTRLDHGWSLWTMVYLLWSWSTMVNHGSRPWLPSRTWFDHVEPKVDHGWPWINMVNHGHISQGQYYKLIWENELNWQTSDMKTHFFTAMHDPNPTVFLIFKGLVSLQIHVCWSQWRQLRLLEVFHLCSHSALQKIDVQESTYFYLGLIFETIWIINEYKMYGLWQYYQVQSFIIFAQRQWNLGKQS
jgi:hypothetical protein